MQIYRYRWNKCGRINQRCIVTARGTMNSCRVEFEDGHVMITSRNAIAKTHCWPAWKSAKVADAAPAGSHYVCGDRGWNYFIYGRDVLAVPILRQAT